VIERARLIELSTWSFAVVGIALMLAILVRRDANVIDGNAAYLLGRPLEILGIQAWLTALQNYCADEGPKQNCRWAAARTSS
jgi:hypothetical protein